MNEQKRTRVRGIIFIDGKMVSMYRELQDRKFYTFPGGGLEGNETEEECVIREVLEEFGLTIKPIKKLYTYENERSIEHFYLCKYLDGKFGSGEGEEFEVNRDRGVYKPTLIEIKDIPNLPLMPPEVAETFYKDYLDNGSSIRENVKFVSTSQSR